MAKIVAKSKNKKVWFSRIFGIPVVIFRPFLGVLQKAFGTLIYKDLEKFDYKYCVSNFEESVKKSV